MPKVTQRGREPFEKMFKRWKRAVEKDDLMKELRKREFYEKPSIQRKRAKAAARKRWERKQAEMDTGRRKRKF